MDKTTYERHGYTDRTDYLLNLACEYGVDEQVVFALASALGPSEDFDGLISSLEDAADMFDDFF